MDRRASVEEGEEEDRAERAAKEVGRRVLGRDEEASWRPRVRGMTFMMGSVSKRWLFGFKEEEGSFRLVARSC
jgi:hypothetical protein